MYLRVIAIISEQSHEVLANSLKAFIRVGLQVSDRMCAHKNINFGRYSVKIVKGQRACKRSLLPADSIVASNSWCWENFL